MNKNSVYEIVLRLFGLYLLYQVPFLLLNIGMAFSQDTSQFITNINLYAAVIVSTPVIYLIISLFLIFKATVISSLLCNDSENQKETQPSNDSKYNHLSFWIVLIGLFYLVSFVSSLIDGVLKLPISSPGWFWWGTVLSNLFGIILSLVYTFRSNLVVGLIKKHSTKN